MGFIQRSALRPSTVTRTSRSASVAPLSIAARGRHPSAHGRADPRKVPTRLVRLVQSPSQGGRPGYRCGRFTLVPAAPAFASSVLLGRFRKGPAAAFTRESGGEAAFFRPTAFFFFRGLRAGLSGRAAVGPGRGRRVLPIRACSERGPTRGRGWSGQGLAGLGDQVLLIHLTKGEKESGEIASGRAERRGLRDDGGGFLANRQGRSPCTARDRVGGRARDDGRGATCSPRS